MVRARSVLFREAAIGFLAKTAFWLGLVYSAMPFDSGTTAFAPMMGAVPDSLETGVVACVSGMTETCRRTANDLRIAVKAAAAFRLGPRNEPRPAPHRSQSTDTLTAKDRAQPSDSLPAKPG
jgi:hypothetical protein